MIDPVSIKAGDNVTFYAFVNSSSPANVKVKFSPIVGGVVLGAVDKNLDVSTANNSIYRSFPYEVNNVPAGRLKVSAQADYVGVLGASEELGSVLGEE